MSENLEANASKADKALPGVEVTINGVKRVLKYSLYSLCKLDEKTGKNPLDGNMFAAMRPLDIVAVLWAGLLHEDKNLDIDVLAEQIDIFQLREVSESMMKAFIQSAPVTDEAKKNSTSEELTQTQEQEIQNPLPA